MSDADEGTALVGEAGEREYGPVALVLACVAAVVLATALVPLITADGAGSPAESLVPLPGDAGDSAAGEELARGAAGFGALNVGNEQSVGGQIGASEGNPFRARSTEAHFQVRSEEPSYWRTGSFDTYEGDGWSSSGPSDTSAPMDGREVRYEVELERPAGSPPTVWRPTALEDADGVKLTDSGVARADGRLDAGDSYVGVSRKPPRDPSVLATSGREYPETLAERYTQLPDRTDSELGPMTAEITADAGSPYETAVAVETWLESNKRYSLNVSEPRGDDVARQFVFDMDAGYCEYFATSMVAMLRTQGVPARYAVGYSTGQQVDENTYQVRGMNAHAWVEVYFADVGWVRFDPTPGSERLRAERDSFQENGSGGEYEPVEEGSPNETFAPGSVNESTGENASDGNGSTPQPDATPSPDPSTPDDPSENETDDGPGPYDVSLNRSAVPGTPVEISVTSGALPVAGAEVSVNGERVGVTDRDGTVATTVPYESEFVVSVSNGNVAEAAVSGVGAPAVESVADRGESGPDATASDSETPAARANADRKAAGERDRRQADNDTEAFEVRTDATLSVTGGVRTGETVVVTATVDDVPVRGGDVFLDGERIAETDADGQAEVPLPSDPGNATLRVERDPIAGERTLELGAVNVTVDPSWPLPVAGTGVEITATIGEEPAAGVPVSLAGERVGETGVNGTVSASLPFESSVPVAVSTAGQTARTTVTDPLINLAGLFVALVGLVAASAVALSRRDVRVRALSERLLTAIRDAPRTFVRALVGGARAAERGWTALVARAVATVAHLRVLASGDRSAADLLAAFRAWTRSRLAGLRELLLVGAGSTAGARGGANGGSAQAASARTTVREAWDRFLGRVSIRGTGTKTPGQIATHAVASDGLPADAVATLRDEFRAVEYGPRSPDDAVPNVAEAIDRIEAAIVDRESAGSAADAVDERDVDDEGSGEGSV